MDVNLIAEYLAYEPETGVITWIKSPGKDKPAGRVAGRKSPSGYILIGLRGKEYRAHRLAWALQTGETPPEFLDHVNGQRDDNRWLNLRAATRQENTRNRFKRAGCRSLYKGVTWCNKTGVWKAAIGVGGKSTYLGSFLIEEDAAKEYDNFAKQIFGGFAKLNIYARD